MKERKILTKLGIIFGIVDLLLILFGVIFLKPKQVLAETPDAFLMNEIYLYNRNTFNLNPNFENDYLMKTTILPSDIESDNTSNLLGWYKNLGYSSLIVPYYGEDDNLYVTFAIPLKGILAVNFQLAYNVSSPTLLDFYLLFDDGTRQEWDTEQTGFGSRILSIDNNNINKNCYAFCWEAYSPDYVPSFKFLGVTDGYEIGYDNGYIDGYLNGNETGYNSGYNYGYQDGISSNEIIYTKILNFNQLVKYGNFPDDTTGWSYSFFPTTREIENNSIIISNSGYNNGDLRSPTINIINEHQYYYSFFAKGITDYYTLQVRIPPSDVKRTINLTDNLTRYSGKITATSNGDYIDFLFSGYSTSQKVQMSNIYLIDLTTMYGVGNEPNETQCNNIFNQSYYNYTEGTPVEMGFFTGYYDGKDDGINEGINIGETNQINMNWIQSIFQAMQGFFNIQIFPHVTLGIIVGIPFVISLAWFVIKMFRGGGGGED